MPDSDVISVLEAENRRLRTAMQHAMRSLQILGRGFKRQSPAWKMLYYALYEPEVDVSYLYCSACSVRSRCPLHKRLNSHRKPEAEEALSAG